MTTYYIRQSSGAPLAIEIEGIPPCLFCGEPVHSPSMDGPLVCACCDCGCNRDGSKWTAEQLKERWEYGASMIAKYHEAADR